MPKSVSKVLGGRAGAEAVHADELAIPADHGIPAPAHGGFAAILTGRGADDGFWRSAGCASSSSSEGTDDPRGNTRSASCFWAATATSSTSEPEANSVGLASGF